MSCGNTFDNTFKMLSISFGDSAKSSEFNNGKVNYDTFLNFNDNSNSFRGQSYFAYVCSENIGCEKSFIDDHID